MDGSKGGIIDSAAPLKPKNRAGCSGYNLPDV